MSFVPVYRPFPYNVFVNYLIMWIKFIFTNNHRMSNVYADSFGICEKWLIYYTMIKYFHFLFKLIFLGKTVALTMAIFHS